MERILDHILSTHLILGWRTERLSSEMAHSHSPSSSTPLCLRLSDAQGTIFSTTESLASYCSFYAEMLHFNYFFNNEFSHSRWKKSFLFWVNSSDYHTAVLRRLLRQSQDWAGKKRCSWLMLSALSAWSEGVEWTKSSVPILRCRAKLALWEGRKYCKVRGCVVSHIPLSLGFCYKKF